MSLTKKSAIFIYIWLVALTLIEVWIVAVGIPKNIGLLLMLGTTLGKVLMIVLYFMHMKHDRLLIWLLPGIPVLLALFFILMIFPDMVYHLPLRFR